MPTVNTVGVPITVAGVLFPPAAASQPVNFTGNLEWCLFQNDCPFRVVILDHGGDRVLVHLQPGDVKPYWFGDRDFNKLHVLGEAVSAAGDIAVGDILYIDFKLKRRDM